MSENSRIFQAVLKYGVDQWSSIGLAVGLNLVLGLRPAHIIDLHLAASWIMLRLTAAQTINLQIAASWWQLLNC
jgi:hypothetical protein